MAKETVFKGNNFAADGAVSTTYLNYAGLSTFWGKVKEYVDGCDTALVEAVSDKIDLNDSLVRSYIESLSVNGVDVVSNKADGTLGTELNVEITGAEVEVGADAGKYTSTTAADGRKYKVSAAFKDVDARLNAAEKTLKEGVINAVDTVDTDNAEVEGKNYGMVEFSHSATGDAAEGNYTVTFTVDETKLDSKLDSLDEKIVELEANAGIVGLRVHDKSGETDEGATEDNYVKFTINSTPFNESSEDTVVVDGITYYKSLVDLTVDESALDDKFESVDATIATEIADRKEDIAALAGAKYTVANGDAAGSWQTTGEGAVKWSNITAIDEYLKSNEANLMALTDQDGVDAEAGKTVLKVNGRTIITATSGDQVQMKGTSIALTTSDILHDGDNATQGGIKGESIAAILDDHENRIDALSSATHFIGVTEENLQDGATATTVTLVGSPNAHTLQDGDVVIVKHTIESGDTDTSVSREFIWSSGVWYELGDTTQEAERLTKVETWIDENIISSADINDLFDNTNNIAGRKTNFETELAN